MPRTIITDVELSRSLETDANGFHLADQANARKIVAQLEHNHYAGEPRRSELMDALQDWLCIDKTAALALLDEIMPQKPTDEEWCEYYGEVARELASGL